MLIGKDGLALCNVGPRSVESLVEQEHIPKIGTDECGRYLAHIAEGGLRIRRIILDDIDAPLRPAI